MNIIHILIFFFLLIIPRTHKKRNRLAKLFFLLLAYLSFNRIYNNVPIKNLSTIFQITIRLLYIVTIITPIFSFYFFFLLFQVIYTNKPPELTTPKHNTPSGIESKVFTIVIILCLDLLSKYSLIFLFSS